MSKTTSTSAKSSQSGLASIQRNWDPPKTSQETSIYWPPTPPPSAKVPLTGAQKRLQAIQEALAGGPLTASRSFNKRSSDEFKADNDDAPSAKKPRQLPDSWSNKPTASSSSSLTRTSSKSAPLSRTTVKPDPSTSRDPSKIFLSQEQKEILALVKEGNSLFYTGSAGTGKSVLLREIIRTLRKKHLKSTDAVAVTASTGIAACNIGGVTIHSFSGIGLGIESAEELTKKIKKNKKASGRWLRTKVLIIDEVSMVDGDLFDKLAKIGSLLRKSSEPFGGIQVIVTGDFFQLPPVTKGGSNVKFAFEAEQWMTTIKRTFNLTKVFRQTDQEFVDMLNEMRFGRLSEASAAKFKALSRPIEYDDGLGPTELFPRREDVDRANTSRLGRLPSTEVKSFDATHGGAITDQSQRERLLSNFMAPGQLTLKVNTQVMLIKNMDDKSLVNGSMGRVLRFADAVTYAAETGAPVGPAVPGAPKAAAVGGHMQFPVVEFLLPHGGKKEMLVTPETFKVELPNGEVQVSRTQLPLILAWAMSIHKSQGQTLDRVRVDLGKVFEKGQAYVALSRATSLEGLQVLNFSADKVNAHPKVALWSRTLETITESGR